MNPLHAFFQPEPRNLTSDVWFLINGFYILWDHSSLEPKYPEQLKDDIPEFIDLNRRV